MASRRVMVKNNQTLVSGTFRAQALQRRRHHLLYLGLEANRIIASGVGNCD